MYGITKENRKYLLEKIKREKEFLNSNHFSIGSDKIKMSDLVKNAYHNSDRYIAEVNHRVYSLFHHANNKGLKNIFGTITLPSEYHRLISNKYYNPKYCNKHLIEDIDRLYCPYTKKEQFDYDKYSPKSGTKELSRMFKKMLDLRAYRNIDKEDKCYFRVYEPHGDGTPHLHFSMFVPEDQVENLAERFKKHFADKYPGLEVDFQTDIKNPIAYLMKYILKTFDDLRGNEDNITDLSLWYKAHKITRFYTSKTLVSLEIYRKLNGRYNLLELTHMYKNRELSVLLDIDTNKVVSIYDSIGRIYNKKDIKINLKKKEKSYTLDELAEHIISKNEIYKEDRKLELEEYLSNIKIEPKIVIDDKPFILKNKKLTPISIKKPVKHLSDLQLCQLYIKLDTADIDTINYAEYGLVKNEMINRDLLQDLLIPINNYILPDMTRKIKRFRFFESNNYDLNLPFTNNLNIYKD